MNGVALIEAVFRAERARVLATTIRVTRGDFDLAEEVVQEAFAAAVARWPTEGTPDDPLAWLITVARNKAVDAIRRRIRLREILLGESAEEEAAELESGTLPDDRLRLIYTCCHPALAPEAQIALTLRTLGGLTTEEIARAFLTSPATLAQRLVRAKRKISAAGIPYRVPEAAELPERTAAVMNVVYLIFNEGYAATAGDAWIRQDLCREAIRLGRLLTELTRSPESQGLLALMLLQDSRRDARVDANGDVVLLEAQDRSRWDRSQIDEALALVPLALRGGAGAYGLQAAIAALHATASSSADTDWPQIAALFTELLRRDPSPVIALNRAVAIAMFRGPEAGLQLIEPLSAELADYHLWHAARADLLRRMSRKREAAEAYKRALDCVGSAPERRFLERRLRELESAK
jgi:RNA polymerase sigma-70 factor, ECF subfamily